VKKQFSLVKKKEVNTVSEDLNNLTDIWTQLELNNLIRALRPQSFREGKVAVDFCLQTGSKFNCFYFRVFFIFISKVPKTKEDCKYVPALMDCFIKSSPFNEKFWKKESTCKNYLKNLFCYSFFKFENKFLYFYLFILIY